MVYCKVITLIKLNWHLQYTIIIIWPPFFKYLILKNEHFEFYQWKNLIKDPSFFVQIDSLSNRSHYQKCQWKPIRETLSILTRDSYKDRIFNSTASYFAFFFFLFLDFPKFMIVQLVDDLQTKFSRAVINVCEREKERHNSLNGSSSKEKKYYLNWW